MKHFQLVFAGRDSQTHKVLYQIICNGEIIESDCTYPGGYAKLAKLMTIEDTYQEIEGDRQSDIFTYAEMLNGYLVLNWDELYPNK